MEGEAGGDILSRLNWISTRTPEHSGGIKLPPIDVIELQKYAIKVKRALSGDQTQAVNCKVLPQYNLGGLHQVRPIEFSDGEPWIARIQLSPDTPDSQNVSFMRWPPLPAY